MPSLLNIYFMSTGSYSLLPGHLSHLVRRGHLEDLVSNFEEEHWGATYSEPVLPGEHWRSWGRHNGEEEEEEEEEGSGR